MEIDPEQFLKALQEDFRRQSEIEHKFYQSCDAMREISPILEEEISIEMKVAKADAISKKHGFESIQDMHIFRTNIQNQLHGSD